MTPSGEQLDVVVSTLASVQILYVMRRKSRVLLRPLLVDGFFLKVVGGRLDLGRIEEVEFVRGSPLEMDMGELLILGASIVCFVGSKDLVLMLDCRQS